MPKYHNTKNDPKRPDYTPGNNAIPTDEQVNEWWEALAKGLNEDPEIGRDLEGNGRNFLYFFDNSGKLVPALDAEEKTGDGAVRRRLMEQAQNRRLYIRAVNETVPRQIITERKEPFDCSVSELSWGLPKMERPVEPKKPFFLKRWLPFFFRAELNTYEEKKSAYDAAMEEYNWRAAFNSRDNANLFVNDWKAEKDQPEYAARAKEKQDFYQRKEEEKEAKSNRKKAAKGKSDELELERRSITKGPYNTDRQLIIVLQDPALAKETKYNSAEELFDALDKGETIKEEGVFSATMQINIGEGSRASQPLPELLARALKFNNERINRYTPDQLQFHYISMANKEILDQLKRKPQLLEEMKAKGITEEDLQLAKGVIKVAEMHEEGILRKQAIFDCLAGDKKIYLEDMAQVVVNETIHSGISLHNKFCKVTEENSPNPIFLKLGKDAPNLSGAGMLEKLGGELRKDEKAVAAIKEEANGAQNQWELFSDTTRLRKFSVSIMQNSMEKTLGLDAKPPQKEEVKEKAKEEVKGEVKEEAKDAEKKEEKTAPEKKEKAAGIAVK